MFTEKYTVDKISDYVNNRKLHVNLTFLVDQTLPFPSDSFNDEIIREDFSRWTKRCEIIKLL